MEKALFQKLKLDKFTKIAWMNKSKENSVFDDLELSMAKKGEAYDLLLIYVYSLEEMKEFLLKIIQDTLLMENGAVYLLYPKVKNPLGHPAIGRDEIFPFLDVNEEGYALNSTLKFNEMNKLDESYTLIGLKNSLSFKPQRNTPSQRVEDYADKVNYVKVYLQDYPKAGTLYETLPPGYQKDWARYIYSARERKHA